MSSGSAMEKLRFKASIGDPKEDNPGRVTAISVMVEEQEMSPMQPGAGRDASSRSREEYRRNRMLELYINRALGASHPEPRAVEEAARFMELANQPLPSASRISRSGSATPALSSDSQHSSKDSSSSGHSSPDLGPAPTWPGQPRLSALPRLKPSHRFMESPPSSALAQGSMSYHEHRAAPHASPRRLQNQRPSSRLVLHRNASEEFAGPELSKKDYPYQLFHNQGSWYADIGRNVLVTSDQHSQDDHWNRPVLAPGYGRPARGPWYAQLGNDLLGDSAQIFGPGRNLLEASSYGSWQGVPRSNSPPLQGGDLGSFSSQDSDTMGMEWSQPAPWDILNRAEPPAMRSRRGSSPQSGQEAGTRVSTSGLGRWSPPAGQARMRCPSDDLSELSQLSLRRQSTEALLQQLDSTSDTEDQGLERVRPAEETDRTSSKPYCVFCKKNSWSGFRNHTLKDAKGLVSCPRLQKLTCPYCGATGKRAHTITYCPKAAGDGASLETMISCRRKVHKKSNKKTVLSRLSKFLDSSNS